MNILEKFTTDNYLYYDENKNEGFLCDEEDNEILKFSYDDENSPFELKLYIGLETFDLSDIKDAKMDKHHKQELVLWFEILQHELDLKNPNEGANEISNDGLNYIN